MDVLEHATGGEIYIFGGTVRRALFNISRYGDLDLMVPNGDARAFDTLDALHVPFEFNSQHHHRYRWNALQIDMFQPHEFYGGFEDVNSALCFFDLRINALALHLRSACILDPFQVLSQPQLVDPGINWVRWSQMPLIELVVLAIRLLKVMHEMPMFTISRDDVERLRNDVVSKVRECDWSTVHNRFPMGKDAFLEMFEAEVLSRTKK